MWIPEPDVLMAGGDDDRLAELRTGRELYINKCSGCHALMPVDRYDDARWKAEVAEMVKLNKVRLTGDEQGRLIRYLTTANDRPRP